MIGLMLTAAIMTMTATPCEARTVEDRSTSECSLFPGQSIELPALVTDAVAESAARPIVLQTIGERDP